MKRLMTWIFVAAIFIAVVGSFTQYAVPFQASIVATQESGGDDGGDPGDGGDQCFTASPVNIKPVYISYSLSNPASHEKLPCVGIKIDVD